jgi:Fe-S-cluster containining protein
MSTSGEEEKSKQKFLFNCTKCGKCCENRGPIPIVFSDIQSWAKNETIGKVFPHLRVYKTTKGFYDLILSPVGFEEQKNESKKICPLFNSEKKECQIYESRPLSCQSYPLEFDGSSYEVIDDDCSGIGKEPMTKEERVKMKEQAQTMNKELVTMRVSIPIIYQIAHRMAEREIFGELMRQQEETLKNMDPEEKKKFDEMFKNKKEK